MAAAPEGGGKPKAASRLASPSFWAKLSLLSVALAVLSSYAYSHPSTQLFFMRFFRDVARARAHARLHGNAYALQVLMGEDEVLLSAATASRPFGNPDSGLGPVSRATRVAHTRTHWHTLGPTSSLNATSFLTGADQVTEYAPDTGVTFTADELARFDGTDGAPLYLAVRGRVYDVSARPGFYGKRAQLACFVLPFLQPSNAPPAPTITTHTQDRDAPTTASRPKMPHAPSRRGASGQSASSPRSSGLQKRRSARWTAGWTFSSATTSRAADEPHTLVAARLQAPANPAAPHTLATSGTISWERWCQTQWQT